MGLSNHQNPGQEGTFHVKITKWRPALKVTADGKGVATHAGSRLLAEMADRSGLTDALSEALAPMCRRRRRHDPGKVISDLAVTIAGGGDALANLLGLRLQADVFGAVASVPTAFRVIDAIDDTLLAAMRQARSRVRRSVWGAGLNPVTEHGYVTLDFDATLLDAHSDKEQAAPTYKKGYGFHPLGAWLDITEDVRLAILDVPKTAWVEAVHQDYELREGANVAELTALLDLSSWPEGTRAICRREEPHSGAHFTLFDPEGWRYQVFLTDSVDDDLAYLEARHRGHARVEDRIRCGKDTGLRSFPFRQFAANQVWLELVLAAQDLLTFFQRL